MLMLASAQSLAPTLGALLSPDNGARGQAEASFQASVASAPERVIEALLCISADWCIDGLARQDGASCCGAPAAVRSLCAVLLRRHLVKKWGMLSTSCQATVKGALVASFGRLPPESDLGARVGDCAAELATEIAARTDEEGGLLAAWPELVPALLAALGGAAPTAKRAACDAAFELANEMDEPSGMMRRAFAEALREVVVMSADDWTLRRRATRALGGVLCFASVSAFDDGDAAEVGGWKSVEAFAYGAVEAPLGGAGPHAERALREGLEACVDLAEARPRALRAAAPALCRACLDLALGDATTPSARALAVELVVTLSEAAPAMMRKCRLEGRAFGAVAVDACIELLRRRSLRGGGEAVDFSEDDVDAYGAATTEEPPRDERAAAEVGADALDRIARALRPRAVLPRAAERLRGLLAAGTADPANRWPDARAAFTALTQLAEAYRDLDDDGAVPYLVVVVQPEKKKKKGRSRPASRRRDLVETMLPFATRYPVPQVRKEALDALAQTAADHAPDLELEASDVLIPALCGAAADAAHRCRAAACRALVVVLDSTPARTVARHLDALSRSLWGALTEAPLFVRELAVSALAALASALADDDDDEGRARRATLYGLFAATLKPLAASRDAPAALRARSLECLALLGTAAGREVFGDDAIDLVRVVVTDYFDDDRRRPEDDAERSTALKSVVMVANCLEPHFFEPYLAKIVPPILEAAARADVFVSRRRSREDDDLDLDLDDDDEDLVVRTEALEEQSSAVQLIARLAEALGSQFADHVQGCLVALAPLTTSSLADDVRQYASIAMPGLVACIAMRERDAAGDADADDPWWCYEPAATRAAAVFAVGALLEAVGTEDERDPRLAALQALRATIEDACRVVGVYEDAAIASSGMNRRRKNTTRVETPRECVPLLYGTPVFAAAFRKLLETLQASIQRRAVRLASAKVDVDYDDEQADEDAAERAHDEELLYNLAEVVGSLLRTHGVAALDAFFATGWSDRVRDMAHVNCVEADRQFAAYVIADLFEFGTASPRGDFFQQDGISLEAKRALVVSEARKRCVAAFLDPLVSLARDGALLNLRASAPRRQAAVYGLGVAAEKCARDVAPYAPNLADVLSAVMSQRARDNEPRRQDFDDDEHFFEDDDDDDDDVLEDDVLVSDNAAASLEKLARTHSATLGAATADLWRRWLDYLPMLGDADEADKSVRSLCDYLVSGSTLPALGPASFLGVLSRIADAILDGGYAGTTSKREPTSRSVRDQLSKRRRTNEPASTLLAAALAALQDRDAPDFQAAWAALPPRAQQALLAASR
ncbi:hypothetical protein CTAYLR_009778 [Chrysophaeum taylorii]|uniref:Uncharacterized protein n=1 Tax=Chrysophaeum taylorii TaxID=2483200 RepID=A0AAD7UGB8_9STRA|nr:hypothetical protein CTAYLR_009778 [Chrysophaeum taylorii]